MCKNIILDLCGGTGAWSKPYADAGYDVRVIDPACDTGDVRLYQPPKHVYGVLAAPPCTVFASAGARWPRTDEQMIEALSVVSACVRIIYATSPEWWALENPVGKLIHYLGKWWYTFHPYDYGDPWTKKTCIWGVHRKPIKLPVALGKHADRIHKMPGGKNQAKRRSVTPPGFAKAFMKANP